MGCMALREIVRTPHDVLASLLRPLPGRVIVLVEDPEAPDEYRPGKILKPRSIDAKRRLWQRAIVDESKVVKRFGGARLLRGCIVAAGEAAMKGQPPPPVGTHVFVQEDKYCLRIHPGDEDFPGLGAYVPKGYTLQFFGLREPWELYIVGVPLP